MCVLPSYFTRRNDFISVVRNAARTALENMKIPEAERVLKVTKVSGIRGLSGLSPESMMSALPNLNISF